MPKEKILYIYEYPVSLLIYDPNIPYNIINILVINNFEIIIYTNMRMNEFTAWNI